MDRKSITGIFATHLHELFDLPLNTKTLSYKRMGIDWVRARRGEKGQAESERQGEKTREGRRGRE